MNGLLNKELYLAKNKLLAYGIVIFLFSLLGVLVCISMKCGNLKAIVSESAEMKVYYSGIFIYGAFILYLLSCEESISSVYRDYSIGWANYGYTLPVSNVSVIAVKYIIAGITFTTGLVFGVSYGSLICLLAGIDYSFKMFKVQLIILGVVAAAYVMLVAAAYILRTKKAMVTFVISLMVAIYIGFIAIWSYGNEKYGYDEYGASKFDKIFATKAQEIWANMRPWLPLIIIAWFAFWFYMAVRAYARREKAC